MINPAGLIFQSWTAKPAGYPLIAPISKTIPISASLMRLISCASRLGWSRYQGQPRSMIWPLRISMEMAVFQCLTPWMCCASPLVPGLHRNGDLSTRKVIPHRPLKPKRRCNLALARIFRQGCPIHLMLSPSCRGQLMDGPNSLGSNGSGRGQITQHQGLQSQIRCRLIGGKTQTAFEVHTVRCHFRHWLVWVKQHHAPGALRLPPDGRT